jgi:transcription antitermination factor NusG
LAALGYSAFCPKLRKWVSHARTKTAKEYPILGRYMFVEVPDGDFWTIRNVNGVESLVTNEVGRPQSIPAEVVYAFRDRYMRGEWDFVANETGVFLNASGETETRRNKFPIGAIVKIMEGEFANMLAIVRGQPHGRLKVLPKGVGKFVHTWPENVRAA